MVFAKGTLARPSRYLCRLIETINALLVRAEQLHVLFPVEVQDRDFVVEKRILRARLLAHRSDIPLFQFFACHGIFLYEPDCPAARKEPKTLGVQLSH